MRRLHPTLWSFVLARGIVACAAPAPSRADDAGVVWRASTMGRHSAPGELHADTALVLDGDEGTIPSSAFGSVAIGKIEGGNGGKRRPQLGGPLRATGESTSVDFASLPLLTDVVPYRGSTFRFNDENGCPKPVRSDETKLTSGRELSILRIGGSTSFRRDSERPGRFDAEWIALAANRSLSAAHVRVFEGTFDGETHLGRLDKEGAVDARALIPGVLYAYRRCVAGCGENEKAEPRREEVALIGPTATWRGTSTAQPAAENDQDYGEVRTSIAPGSSATLLLVVTEANAREFRRPPGEPNDQLLVYTFSLEIVWPTGAEPEVTLFAGTTRGDAPDIGPYVPPAKTSGCR